MEKVIYLSLVAASISFTVTETKLFKPFRIWFEGKNSFFEGLLKCGYCFGHWIAFALVVIYRPKLFESWWLLDYYLTALIIAWLAGIQWVLMCWLMEKMESVKMEADRKSVELLKKREVEGVYETHKNFDQVS